MHMTKTHSPFRFLSGKRLLYGFLLIILLGVIVASFSTSLVSKVATWLHTNQPPSTTVMATSASTLIPLHRSPVFNDPLNSQNDPYQWDTGPAGGATCFFAQGAYHISALARSQGGGCNPEAPNITFTNFVYQIRMVINQGTRKELKTGIFFCGTADVLGGSNYGVTFNPQGDWDFGILTGGITGPTVYMLILHGNSQSFLTGTGTANYITVRMTKDHQIDAQVNVKALFHTVDKRLSGGQIGVSINNPGAQDADVSFNNAKVWKL
jgi:hypothetical protein